MEEYDLNPALNSATFKTAIAQTMPGVAPSNIQNFEAESGSFKDSSHDPVDFIILHYDVDVPSKLWQNLLKDAVADGSFDNYLRAAAIESGADDILDANGGTIQTHTIGEEESNHDSLSAGAIVGIVIGSVAALVLLVALLYLVGCCSCWGLGGARNKGQAPPAEEQQDAVDQV